MGKLYELFYQLNSSFHGQKAVVVVVVDCSSVWQRLDIQGIGAVAAS